MRVQRTYLRVYVLHTHVSIYVHTYVRTCMHAYVRTYACTPTHTHSSTHPTIHGKGIFVHGANNKLCRFCLITSITYSLEPQLLRTKTLIILTSLPHSINIARNMSGTYSQHAYFNWHILTSTNITISHDQINIFRTMKSYCLTIHNSNNIHYRSCSQCNQSCSGMCIHFRCHCNLLHFHTDLTCSKHVLSGQSNHNYHRFIALSPN